MTTAPTAQKATKPKPATPKPATSRFKIGDVVHLKSGSESLCVTELGRNDTVRCTWFDERNKIVRATFPEVALRLKEPGLPHAELIRQSILRNAAINTSVLDTIAGR